MPQVDFKPDVDGFAFANNWSFDQRERDLIEEALKAALPVAAAALTPIVMAASPAIAPVAGIALGPVLPLIALAGPFLIAAAPRIAEEIVRAVADALVQGDGKDNLCGGMTAAALDYHCMGWLTPRGTSKAPEFDIAHPDSMDSVLRQRIWDGQMDSHLDNTPRIVLWKAVATIFGDWGRDWLRDQTRAELDKIEAILAGGAPVTLGIVWNTNSVGHIVVGYGLERHGPDACSLFMYDNERPDQECVFDIDLSTTPISIVRRGSANIICDGIMLGTSRFRHPKPAASIAQPLTIAPLGYAVRGELVDAGFTVRNHTSADFVDAGPGLRSATGVVAPGMAFVPPAAPTPIAAGADVPVSISTRYIPEGDHMLEPVVLVTSKIAGRRVARQLPKPDGTPAQRVPYRINPLLKLVDPDAHSGFGCASMTVEGESVTLRVNLAPVIARGIKSITWALSDGTGSTGNSDTFTIPSVPLYPQTIEVKVTVTLADGTECRASTSVGGVSAAIADRNRKLCELAHLVSYVPTRRIPRDLLINPVRAASRKDVFDLLPNPVAVSAEIQKAMQNLLKK